MNIDGNDESDSDWEESEEVAESESDSDSDNDVPVPTGGRGERWRCKEQFSPELTDYDDGELSSGSTTCQ